MMVIYAGMLYYVLYRVLQICNFNVIWWILLSIAVALGIIAGATTWYAGYNRVLIIVGTFSAWSFVLIFLLFIFFLIEHVIEIIYQPNRWIIWGLLLCYLCCGFYFSLVTKTVIVDITSSKVSKDTKILFISDVHSDYIFSTFHLKKVIKAIKEEQPDIVLIGGDLINRPHPDYVNAYKIFNDKSISTPIYAVVGNHDLMGQTEIIQKVKDISPIKILNNESVLIGDIQVIGIIDKSIRRGKTLDEILEESNIYATDKFTILMTHQPIALEKLNKYAIDLEVAGHTHRGQIYGIRKVAELMNDYLYGRYDSDNKVAYISQGIGTWGLPYRLGTQSEMVIINLRKK